MVASLLTAMDGVKSTGQIMVIGATNRAGLPRPPCFGPLTHRRFSCANCPRLLAPTRVLAAGADSLDPALRRAGRFDTELVIGVPSAEGRKEILEIMTRKQVCDHDHVWLPLCNYPLNTSWLFF